MQKIFLLALLTLSTAPAFAQLRTVWESPATIGRKGTAFGYSSNARFFYVQDRLSKTIRFHEYGTFTVKYTLQNLEDDVYPTLTPDLNGNGVEEALIQNFVKGTMTLLDLSTQAVLKKWEHADSSYNWMYFSYSGNVFELLLERKSKVTDASALVLYSNKTLSGVNESPGSGITDFRLESNHPNPFNPGTAIQYSLNRAGRVWLGVYDLQGRLLRTLAEGEAQPGAYTINWDGRDAQGNVVASGTYVYQLRLDDMVMTRKMIKVQ